MKALVATLIGYLARTVKDSKVAEGAIDELAQATWNWIRPIFLKDDEPITDLKKDPEDTVNLQLVEATVIKHLRNNPDRIEELKALVEKINTGHNNANSNSSAITGDNNTVIQSVSGATINVNTPPK